jgi:hypothetical protein
MQIKKIMKISAAVIASSLLLANAAQAAGKGAYAGIGLGASQLQTASVNSLYNVTTNPPSDAFTISTSTRNRGFAGKLFGGYNFNQYIGLEAGYGIYASALQKFTATNTIENQSISGTLKRQLKAVSLVGKAYLPLQQFNLYALAGGAEVFSKVTAKPFASSLAGLSSNGSKSVRSLRPVYGIGANYDINSQVNTGLEWTRIQGKGNLKTSARAIPSANLLILTVAYNFG